MSDMSQRHKHCAICGIDIPYNRKYCDTCKRIASNDACHRWQNKNKAAKYCCDCGVEIDSNKKRCDVCRKLLKQQNSKKFFKKYKYKPDDKTRESRRRYRNGNINVKISSNLRTRIWCALKRERYKNDKQFKFRDVVGCSPEFLKQHIENQFTEGMSWDNYSRDGWHIDHIRPCASFDLSKIEEQARCFHYTNLQPLWAIDNYKKHDKIDLF